MDSIGIFGGTFNPIHFGHLRSVLECHEAIQFKQIRIIPCRVPVLKTGEVASAEHRIKMIELAIKDQKDWIIDEREVKRDTPSYIVDTLISLRQEFPDESLSLIIASDTFAELPYWHRWQEILTFCHLVVTERASKKVVKNPDEVNNLLERFRVNTIEPLHTQSAGSIYVQPVTSLDISSTQIRNLLAQNKSSRFLLPIHVWAYIDKNKLYSKIEKGQ